MCMDGAVERFWCAPDGTYHLDDRGYLLDSGDFLASGGNGVPTRSLLDRQALALLGEPGSGKSTALCDLVRLTRDGRASNSTEAVLVADLATYGDESRIVNEVLRCEQIRRWQAGDGDLFLFLDSLDECRLEVRKIASILAEELSAWPGERLRLRVACRTVDWPPVLANAIKSQMTDVATVELLPLRRRDIAEIAAQEDVDAGNFLEAVERADVVSLAIRPLTLKMLLRTFARDGELPDGTGELYRQGCSLLADEQNPHRRAAGHIGSLTTDHRLAVAARLAGMTLFTGAPAITIAPGGGDASDALTIDSCAGGEEPASGTAVTVDRAAVEETLRSGLFTSRGDERLGWSHQTYAEYLAGCYLAAHGFALNQACQLLTSGVTGRVRVFPAFRRVAAWLVMADPDRFSSLVSDDPQSFLDAGLPLGHDWVTEDLVSALLNHAERGKHAPQWRTRYSHLAHSRLEGQLRDCLADGRRAIEARVLATDIAKAVCVEGLRADLHAVFGDPGEDLRLRVHAGYALDDLPPEAGTATVRGLAEGTAQDVDDDLKGLALQLLWPGRITIDELVTLLTPPRRARGFSAYKGFLSYAMPGSLRPADLPALLNWLVSCEGTSRDSVFDPLADAIVCLALEHLGDPAIRGGLASYAVARANDYETLLSRRWRHEEPALSEDRRLELLGAMIDHLPDDPNQAWAILDGAFDDRRRHALLTSADLGWLLERYDDSTALPRPRLIETLIQRTFHPENRGHAAQILDLPEEHPLRATAFSYWLTPIALASDEATEMRQRLAPAATASSPQSDAPSEEQLEADIRACLDAFEEAGDNAGYVRAQFILAVCEDGGWVNELESDLTALPRWQTLPEDLRRRLITGAPRYLAQARCEPDQWLGTPTMWRPAYAGYRALALLQRLEPDAVDALAPHRWGEWAPVVLAYPAFGEDAEAKRRLLARAASEAPAVLLDAVSALLDAATTGGGTVAVLDELAIAWSEDLALLLASHAKRPEVPIALWHQLIDLLAPRHPAGLALATGALDAAARGAQPKRATVAVKILLNHGLPARWSVLARLLQDDPEFAEAALLDFAHYKGLHASTPPLDVAARADLFMWLAEHFPPQEDPEHNGWVSPRHSVASWRDTILSSIREDGTAQALAELGRIKRRVPDLAWAYVDAGAEEAALTRAWSPLAPLELRNLVEQSGAWLVRDASHLHTVVLEALEAISGDLQSDGPTARWLWDERVMHPKKEAAISDFVKNRLDELLARRGVVVNREVQVRHVRATGLGESVDLLVEATRNTDRARVVIEVKGCWNSGLETDMDTQLRRRYMSDCRTDYGIYLVAWFSTDAWETGTLADGRRDRTARLDWPTTVQKLEALAQRAREDGALISVHVLDASWRRPRAEDASDR